MLVQHFAFMDSSQPRASIAPLHAFALVFVNNTWGVADMRWSIIWLIVYKINSEGMVFNKGYSTEVSYEFSPTRFRH